MTKLELINYVLSLIGENKLENSNTQLGNLVANTLLTAFSIVAQETRHRSFSVIIQDTATEEDYLLPALSLSPNIVQISSLSVRVSVPDDGDYIDELSFSPIQDLDTDEGYCTIGNDLYLSRCFTRPVVVFINAISVPSLPALDTDTVNLPRQVLSAIAHTSASILSLSYLDNPNAAAVQQNQAQILIDKLQKQQGEGRGKKYKIGQERKTKRYRSSYSTAVYASLVSPAFTGTPTAPTPSLSDSSTLLATTAFVKGQNYLASSDLSPYLTIATAASTYQPLSGMGDYLLSATAVSTYQTIAGMSSYLLSATAASTYQPLAGMSSYLTVSAAASTYAPLASPAFTGTPTAPTQASTDSSTLLATTAFVSSRSAQAWQTPTLLNAWTNFGAPYFGLQYRLEDKAVRFRGVIKNTGVPSNNVICNVPVGFRPSSNVLLLVGSGNNTGGSSSILVIQTNGDVVYIEQQYGAGGTSLSYVSCEFSYGLD